MDLEIGEEYKAFQAEVKAFLRASWPPAKMSEDAVRAFRTLATEAGYLYRNVPKRYGGSEQSADAIKAQIIRDCFRKARAPMEVMGNGVSLLVPTLLGCGEEWQKEKFVPRTLTGEYFWAQGYSEPGSGSDLASIRTRAELVGDEWIINGQKIWTSGGYMSNYMFALVRTEPDKPKHEGISYLLLDLKQPGVEVRPLKQITGGAEFCEVFFTDARTPADWIVGKRGEGWEVSRTTLKVERTFIGGVEGYLDMFEKLVALAKDMKRGGHRMIDEPEIRNRLASLQGYLWAHKYSSYRQLSMTAAGKEPGIVTLMNKLVVSNLAQEIARISQEVMGDYGLMLPAQRKAGPEKWVNQFMGSLGVAIAGGTANIQRNIISERGLGLPRDTTATREAS